MYRECTCRGADGKQLGKALPCADAQRQARILEFKVDLPRVNGRRREMHRRDFPSQRTAVAALRSVADRLGLGVKLDDRETTGDYLTVWLVAKKASIKPTTWHNYAEHVTKDLVPALGSVRLEQLRHEHVQQLVTDLTAAGRGATTVRRIVATLSSALGDAGEAAPATAQRL